MANFGKILGRLIAFSAFVAWFVFTIWGIAKWDDPASFVSQHTTLALLYVPLFIGMFILFIVVMAIGAITKASKKRKDKKKETESTEIKGLEDLKKLEDVKDWEEFKAMIPAKWKDKVKKWVEDQEK